MDCIVFPRPISSARMQFRLRKENSGFRTKRKQEKINSLLCTKSKVGVGGANVLNLSTVYNFITNTEWRIL